MNTVAPSETPSSASAVELTRLSIGIPSLPEFSRLLALDVGIGHDESREVP
jgi:hypothetical protein